MKRCVRTAAMTISVIICLLLLSGCGTKAFDADDYAEFYFENEYSTSVSVNSREGAVSAAKELWRELYGIGNTPMHCEFFRDEQSGCVMVSGMEYSVWCTQFSPFIGTAGGVYYAVFAQDGRLMGVWVDM